MEVEVIKAQNIFDDSMKKRGIHRLRVAAYCRVSTDDEDQLKSYNSMVKYYTELIQSNKSWVFMGVFADKAITGTKADIRENFQKLIQLCMEEKVDMVITKSIPRFARNTLDTLKYVRLLREKNIAVYFEVEKINTMTDGEFLLTILGSVAQQEVENTSAYVKKGLKMKMKRGELIGFQSCLGYDYDVETKQLSINEDGAELVRYIFNRYISGAGGTMIARELNEQGYLTIRGNPWSCSSVIGIITNEKYIGDVLQGKTYTVDPISKRRVNNYGQEDRFYIKNHHEPIISKEVYDKAQEIRLRRNQGRKGFETGKREKYSRKYAFSSFVQCEFCGGFLSRRSWHSGTKHQKTIWQCNVAIKKGKQFCPHSKGIAEKIIEDAFVEAYQLMASENRDMLDEFIVRVEKTLSGTSAREMISQLTKRLYSLQDKRQRLLDNFLNGIVVKEVYLDKDKKFEKDISVLKKQIKEYEILNKNEAAINKRMVELRKALSTNIVLDKFDREVFESIIAKVIVGGYNKDNTINPYKITFIFKTGLQSEINGKKLDNQSGSFDVVSGCSKVFSNHHHDTIEACSNSDVDTCGDGVSLEQPKI